MLTYTSDFGEMIKSGGGFNYGLNYRILLNNTILLLKLEISIKNYDKIYN